MNAVGSFSTVAALLTSVILLLPQNAAADAVCTEDFATGGDDISLITVGDNQYCVHVFTESGDFEPLEPLQDVDYLIVGGGGSGGSAGPFGGGGGGGAGGMLEGSINALSDVSYAITVGQGGASIFANHTAGNSGENSSAFGFTAIGGGSGGSGNTGGGNGGGPTSGGSGGGQGTISTTVVLVGDVSGTQNQGNDGGTASPPSGGGGGGAGAPGGSPPNTATAANGGDGLASSITGNEVFYAGGGAGSGPTSTGNNATAISPPRGDGGSGGGGGEGAIDGVDGKGGGGAGGLSNVARSGAGGSGIVVVRYLINTRPTADAGADATAVAFQPFTLDGSGTTDPDGPTVEGNIVSYQWAQTVGTSVTLSDASEISPSFTPPQPANGAPSEILTFELTVTDAFELTHTDTVTITLLGVAVLEASKTVSVFSEDGSDCDDFNATAPAEPALPAAIPGACIEYEITVENTGPVAAETITLSDTLPNHLTFVAAELGSNWDGPPTLTTPGCPSPSCQVLIEDGVLNANTTATITIRATIN
ncbi:glycine-rich domain-containing protein [Roseinatronobacter monicus]|uniref:Putative repeat protein (TIGR01451 family) n=1 Tax=Roseinatronobacter monicus TaxID=393481 RepID=A0A543K4I5_9RHOB|nr:DUF11 domain-containing protein [Roseinatronobacter monicus]TQM89983.1 putative repeat protein (TIGR01451 family) [Roseinatronobacter monicus]